MVLIYWFKKTFDLAANMAAQNIKIWKKFRIKILQVPETKAQWKKHTPKRKGDTLETRFSKKNSCIRVHRWKRIRAKSSTTDYKSKQKKKKLIYTQKKNKPIESKTFGALTTQFQINYLFFELETGWNNGGMKKKSIRINRPDWAP